MCQVPVNYLLLLLLLCMYMHDICVDTDGTLHTWRLENSTVELVLSFLLCIDPRVQTQVTRVVQ